MSYMIVILKTINDICIVFININIYIYLYILHYTIMHYMWNYVEYSKFGAPIHPELKSPFKVLRAPPKKKKQW